MQEPRPEEAIEPSERPGKGGERLGEAWARAEFETSEVQDDRTTAFGCAVGTLSAVMAYRFEMSCYR
jgi:hypothetical protein